MERNRGIGSSVRRQGALQSFCSHAAVLGATKRLHRQGGNESENDNRAKRRGASRRPGQVPGLPGRLGLVGTSRPAGRTWGGAGRATPLLAGRGARAARLTKLIGPLSSSARVGGGGRKVNWPRTTSSGIVRGEKAKPGRPGHRSLSDESACGVPASGLCPTRTQRARPNLTGESRRPQGAAWRSAACSGRRGLGEARLHRGGAGGAARSVRGVTAAAVGGDVVVVVAGEALLLAALSPRGQHCVTACVTTSSRPRSASGCRQQLSPPRPGRRYGVRAAAGPWERPEGRQRPA